MEAAEEITEGDQYGENDTQPLNSEGEEEENYYEEEYRSERRRKKSYSDQDEKFSQGDVQDDDVNLPVDYNNKHVKRRRSGGDHSDGDSDHRHHSRHRSIDRERDREHGNHRRRHHRSRRKDRERSRHTRRQNDSRSSQELEAELEDGELEDGELDDDDRDEYNSEVRENITPTKVSPAKLDRKESSERSSPKKHQLEGQAEDDYNPDYREYPENTGAWPSDGEEDGNMEGRSRPRKDDQHDKRRRKEKRDKDKRRKQQKEDKKKKKRREYHDYDQVEEEQAWGTGTEKHLNQNTRGSRGSYDRSPPGPYDDQFEEQGQYDKNYNSPPGHYDSPYDSPPGPYDSPSYDEDSDGEIYDKGTQRKPRRTMMSMVEGDFVDANVAIDEGENIYKHMAVSNKKMKHMKQMKRKMDRQQQGEQPPKKKPLLLTPMNERPICKFYKEGKCSKGNDCPFNHDYRPPKKMDLCKFYLNSQCSKGENCIFMHGEFPCKFFHTGAKCYSGDNCKFSHDPLTDETGPIVEKFFQDFPRDEEMHGEGQRMGPPRPSLLGSPPRHITEQSERVKKIPSIFDIKVFPPGQSPKKPMNDGPPNVHPPQMFGPPRPSGFYTDMNQPPPMQGPPMPHQQGPQMPGPNQLGQSMPGPHQQGPQMSGPHQQGPQMSGPHQQGPQMSGPHQQGPPMSGPHQQGPPMSGPHQQGPPMSGPHQQGPPMSGPHQQGPPMSGPHQQGPPMPGPPHGPPMSGPNLQGPGMPPMQGPPIRGPHMQGPPMQNPPVSSSAMNPAVALVGALLRQAAPQVLRQNIGPPGPQNMRPPGPQNTGPPGPQNMAPPGPMQNMPPPFQGPNQTGPFSSPQGTFGSSNDNMMSPPHEQNPAPADQQVEDKEGDPTNPDRAEVKTEDTGKNEPEKTDQPEAENDSETAPAEEESNEKKLSTLGVNLDTLTHLPAKQRELFLRIQNQQGEGVKDIKTEQEDNVDQTQEEKLDDDNWYSSDEEDVPSSKPKLTDILKNLSQQPTPDSPQTPIPTSQSQSSALDIMQMINSIRTQASNTGTGTPDIPTNSNPPNFPKDASGLNQFTNESPKVNTAVPDPVIINSSEGDIPYKLRPFTIDKSQNNKPPPGMDVHHVQFKNDPRIKKFLIYLESIAKEVKPPLLSDPGEVGIKVDPRTGQPTDRRIDPRIKSRMDAAVEGSRTFNPNPQSSVSDSMAAQPNIPPHLNRAPSNPLPTSLNIGLNQRPDGGPPLDPRMARQMSRDGSALGGLLPKPDPRIGRQMAGPAFAGANGMAMDALSRPADSRMSSQDPRKGQQDSRMGPQDPRMGPQDPRMGLQDPRMGQQDPRMGQQDPRMGQQDPRMGPQDPRKGSQDPRMGSQDPRMGPQDPRMGSQDPRMGPQDPRMGSQDPRMGSQDPRMGSQDPRMGSQDPRMGSQDPRMGSQDPRTGFKDPRVNTDPRKFPPDPRTFADMESQRPTDPRSLQRQGSIGADPRKPLALDPRRSLPGDISSGQSSSDSESKKVDESDTPKPKLDYRNDPRFKRKPASESVVHKRYTGQRKSSMDYSSPLGLDSEDKGDGASGYNSYHRPPQESAKHKMDPRSVIKNKLDPRTSKPEGSLSPNIDSSPIPPIPPPPPDGDIGMPVALELPPFVPPNALEPQMKDFFKTMDPTASPFC